MREGPKPTLVRIHSDFYGRNMNLQSYCERNKNERKIVLLFWFLDIIDHPHQIKIALVSGPIQTPNIVILKCLILISMDVRFRELYCLFTVQHSTAQSSDMQNLTLLFLSLQVTSKTSIL